MSSAGHMNRILLVVIALVGSTSAARAQAAPELRAQGNAREGAVLLGQVAGGAAALGLTIAVGWKVESSADGSSDGGALLVAGALAPVAAGLAVCGIGSFSTYESSCGNGIAGAYIGALGGGIVGYLATPYDEYYPPAQLIGAIVGGLIGATVGATVGWRLGKRLRLAAATPPPTAAVPETARPDLARRSAFSVTAPGELRVMVPVLGFGF